MFTGLKSFFGKTGKDERGASAVEYALIAGLIAVAIIIAVQALGTKVSGTFDTVEQSLPASGG